MDSIGMLTPREFWSMIDEHDEQVRQSFQDLPLYAPAGWPGPAMIGEWILDGGPRGLMYGAPEGNAQFVHVRTTVNDPRDSTLLLWMQRNGPGHDKAEYSRRRSDFEAETPVRRPVRVADSVLDFDFWEDGDQWWAAGSCPGYGLALEARNISPHDLALVVVNDIEPYITGTHEWMRKLRGET